ncbi:MAG: DNA polymerase I [Desulfocapsaceae bacterium]|nr:DNA polymerase I [Desulfocapsaceae bacterium]
MSREVYLIDGSAYIYRAYHAIVPLSNSRGVPTHAVLGFVNIIHRLLKEKKPEYMAVAFDSRGPVFRHEMYPDYKANRPSMPEDLAVQIPYIKRFVAACNIPSFEKPGVEADDIIASASRYLAGQGYEIIIVSSDKDLLQLVGDHVVMWDPMRDRVYDAEEVRKKYNVGPEQLLDCFALIGDSSDNVPGVAGIGPKTAEKLINEHGSLDGVYGQLEKMKASKMKQRLEESRDMAYLSRQLINLKTDVDVSSNIADYCLPRADDEQLQELYKELEFKRLIQDVDTADAAIPVSAAGFRLVQTEEDLQALQDDLAKAVIVTIDTETTSLDTRLAELVGISICTALEQSWYIPVGHRLEDGARAPGQLDLAKVTAALQPFLEASALPKLGHNIKYDYAVILKNCGVRIAGPLRDTMIAAYLLDPTRRSLKLDDLCLECGLQMTSFAEVVGDDKRDEAFAYVDIRKACLYSCEDVHGALKLWYEYHPRLKEFGLISLFADVEMPLVPVLADMEATGIRIDPEVLSHLFVEFGEKLLRLEREIYLLAGTEFNIQSTKQLGKILFEEMRLPFGRKTKTGYSTDIKVLEKLALRHDLPARIMEYRTVAKLQSTYVDKLTSLMDKRTGRIHTSYNQTVTATGRLSSSNPNLQNIPIRSDDGNRIRAAFIPSQGHVFMSADYSQIDLRVLAHYSRDRVLVEAFNKGEDIHARTAAEIFSVSALLITPEMRRVAKSINFGIVYGMSSYGLSEQLGIGRKEAQTFIDRYFHLYSGVKTFMNDIVELARKQGFVTTLLNRRRELPDINSKNKNSREFAERIALNTPIQGTAADIIKLAMLSVVPVLLREGLGARLLLQIHDELVFEVPQDQVEKTGIAVRQAMESALPLLVPLTVNLEVGKNLAKG